MTLSIARYAKLIARAHDNDYVVPGPKGSLTIVTAQQWKDHKWDQQPDLWKKAKQEFNDCLDAAWPKGTRQSLAHRPQDGKPLEVREVRWMIQRPVSITTTKPTTAAAANPR